MPTLVVDYGASEARFGILHGAQKIFPNCIATSRNDLRTIIGDETTKVRNQSQLCYDRPHERGYLNGFDTMVKIWDYAFAPKNLDLDPAAHTLVLPEVIANPVTLASTMDEILFEHYGFNAVLRCPPAGLTMAAHSMGNTGKWSQTSNGSSWRTAFNNTFGLVVDSGYSATTITPIAAGSCVPNAFRRLDVGGKLMTNYLKELVSFRQLNLLDETFVMEETKKMTCFVSLNFESDLRLSMIRKPSENPIWRDCVLPDYHHTMQGYVKERIDLVPDEENAKKQPMGKEASQGKRSKADSQVLRLNNERMSVPEVLFRPQDIGLSQAGVVEAITQSLAACDATSASLMAENIVLTGGNSLLPGYAERIKRDLRPLLPDDHIVNVSVVRDPLLSVFEGGKLVASLDDSVEQLAVTKLEYEEHGSHICRTKNQASMGVAPFAPLPAQ